MVRRVLVPAIIGVAVYLLPTMVGGLGRRIAVGAADRILATGGSVPGILLAIYAFPQLEWLLFPAVFLVVRLCRARGGSPGECLAVALAPLAAAVVVPVVVYYTAVVVPTAEPSMRMNTGWFLREAIGGFVTTAIMCLSATWLYFAMVRRSQERSSWLWEER